MNNVQAIIDWLFNQFITLWNVAISSWVLAIPILILIFANIFVLIKSVYSK